MGHVTPILTTHDGIDLVLLNLDEARLLAMLGGVGDRSGTLPCGKEGDKSGHGALKVKDPNGKVVCSFSSGGSLRFEHQWRTQPQYQQCVYSLVLEMFSRCAVFVYKDVDDGIHLHTRHRPAFRKHWQLSIGTDDARVMLLSQTHSLPNLH